MADDFNFKINPADYLGIDYEKFKTEMLELAISQPDKYFKLRKTVLDGVKKKAVQQQYNVYYCLLTTGKQPFLENGGAGPSYAPNQEGNIDYPTLFP